MDTAVLKPGAAAHFLFFTNNSAIMGAPTHAHTPTRTLMPVQTLAHTISTIVEEGGRDSGPGLLESKNESRGRE